MGNSNSLSTSVANIQHKTKRIITQGNHLDSQSDLHNSRRHHGGFKKNRVKATVSDIAVVQCPCHPSRKPVSDINGRILRYDDDIDNPDAEHLDSAMSPGMPRYGQHDVIDPSCLITPRKPSLPGKEIPELRELQREIAFNNKMGINVLGQKSELQKAMEKMRDQVTKKQHDEERKNDRSDLERELEKRALRMKKCDEAVMTENSINYPTSGNEFHRIHAKVNGRMQGFASATS